MNQSRETLLALLGTGSADSHRPTSSTMGRRVPLGDVWQQRVELTAADGHVVPCLFLTPDGGAPWSAGVVAVHQHNGEYQWGKSEPAGIAGNPDLAYAVELARLGVPVLVPDLHGFEERRPDPVEPQRAEQLGAWLRVTEGSSLQALHTADVALATSWLEENHDIRGALGIVGHSLGGQVALFNLACDPRLRAGVVSCGVGTVASFAEHGVFHNPAWFVPGLQAAGDTPLLARALEGQRVRVLSGRQDALFPFEGVVAVVDSFAEGVCDFVPLGGGHAFPPAERAEALAWLRSTLEWMPWTP